ncbi:MAG: hypothetical protein ACW98X_22030 [Promethearchaeota archaeon]|jgi:hypothetical protein
MSERKEKELLDGLIGLMKRVENYKGFTGQRKKIFVIESMRTIFNLSKEQEYLLSEVIDIIILLDKNKLKIRNKIRSCCA